MSSKKYRGGARAVISVLVYFVGVLALFVPLIFVDPDLELINYPPTQGQEFFLFHARFYFEPFIALVFISIASILIGFIILGVIKVKIRAFMALVILGCIYVPFSFFLYLMPYFFDFMSDSIQAGIRRIICERHHTGIVSTNVKYLYDCPLGGYVGIFIIIKNFFVMINLVILSALSGLIFVFVASIFQDEEKYISFYKYLYFCLPIFAGTLPLIGVMAIGQFFDLYANAIYQGLIIIAITISFIPVIIHLCDETNTQDMIASNANKIYMAVALLFFTATTGAIISLVTFIFEYDVLYLYLLHGSTDYHLLFATFYMFFAVMLMLQTVSFSNDGASLADISLIIFISSIVGVILAAVLYDAVTPEHYIWQVQDNLIGRHIYENCLSDAQQGDCPYYLPIKK